MVKHLVSLIAICFSSFLTFSQTLDKTAVSSTEKLCKKMIDTSDFAKWTTLGGKLQISNDGNVFAYSIKTNNKETLVLQHIIDSWKEEILGVNDCFFATNSRTFIYVRNDTLFFFSLEWRKVTAAVSIATYTQPLSNVGRWLAYRPKGSPLELILIDLETSKEQRFSDVTECTFDKRGTVMLITTQETSNGSVNRKLEWISLQDNERRAIWHGSDQLILGCNFHADGNQLTFLVRDQLKASNNNSIWYFRKDEIRAKELLNDEYIGSKTGLSLDNEIPSFLGKEGNFIQFKLNLKNDVIKKGKEGVPVDIWSYKDSILQPSKLKAERNGSYAFMVNTNSRSILQLEYQDEKVTATSSNFVVVQNKVSIKDHWWPSFQEKTYWLVSLADGFRRKILQANFSEMSFSPNDDYLIYFDLQLGGYQSVDLNSFQTVNITKSIPSHFLTYEDYDVKLPGSTSLVHGIAGWKDHNRLLVYDNYDIWLLDPSGKNSPLNITNGYGRRNNIKLRLVYESEANECIDYSGGLLLTAFGTKSKFNGFYRAHLTGKKDPNQLMFGQYTFYLANNVARDQILAFDGGMIPLKAGLRNLWIVKQQSSTLAPNYFLTDDFKKFKPLTNIHPNTKVNWLTTELINWRTSGGQFCQGILYKPENFDSTKQYPLIFNYYQAYSDRIHQFPTPGFTKTNINIPWFVSQGYLVFTPDIIYQKAAVGRSVVSAVVSAAKYLSSRRYVDSKRFGVHGHSFGGFQTNFLITKTNTFAAASEAAGTTDFISSYLAMAGAEGDINRMKNAESAQGRMGGSLWDMPKAYLDNSPIMRVDKISTPLLIMHNKKDASIPWSQGLGWYLAFRRLGKVAWMLQYDNGSHGLGGKDAVDYTIRLTQYFDHYLKDAPAPIWMTQGIPASLKGIETGYAYDPAGNCSKRCKACKIWNEKMKKDSVSMMKEIEETKKSEHGQ